ncbi:hypothetical protein D3C73_1197070 [compost metagenome]
MRRYGVDHIHFHRGCRAWVEVEVLGIPIIIGVGRHAGAILARMPIGIAVIERMARHEADHLAIGIAKHLDQPEGISRQALLGTGCTVKLHVLGVSIRAQQHNGLGGVVVIVQQFLLGPANPGAIVEQGINPLEDRVNGNGCHVWGPLKK